MFKSIDCHCHVFVLPYLASLCELCGSTHILLVSPYIHHECNQNHSGVVIWPPATAEVASNEHYVSTYRISRIFS
jgi:hypothetical protein